MKYFLDTEFIEGPQRKKLLGFSYGWTKPTIDLISIGIVEQDAPNGLNVGREYYAISKDFNLDAAWSNEWIVNNVLLPIYKENIHGDYRNRIPFTYSGMKQVLEMVGKTNKQIAQEVRDFVMEVGIDYGVGSHRYTPVEFWAYYADYDWVVFCQLFGTMMDLPRGFPMYCRDLKQLFDSLEVKGIYDYPFHLTTLKDHSDYPNQKDEHNALADARWNKSLYKFLTNL